MNYQPANKSNNRTTLISLRLLISGILLCGLSGQTLAWDEHCSVEQVLIPYDDSNEYRKINGRKNNLNKRGWGAAGQKLLRVVSKDNAREPSAANNLPNPRRISNIVSEQGETEVTRNAKGLSDLFWLWGQFLDHDITLVHTDPQRSADIAIPAGDADFGRITHLPFSRSLLDARRMRHHPNVLTSYIDGSNIYGSDTTTAKSLRSFSGGQLILNDGFLPQDAAGFYLAGDERANEHIGLTAMHTLWVREHNRIAAAIACVYPGWSDNRIYEETRRIVIAELQAITYNEFLPAMFGQNALPGYWEDGHDYDPGYDDSVQANISNVFAAASYRFGHSMLSPFLLRLDENGEEIAQKHVALKNAFFQPAKLEEAGIEPVLRGLASQVAQALDPMIVDDIRNFLILGPGIAQGFDLAALNIQRGRDHRLPGYNDVRAAFGLRRIDSFHDSIWREDFRERMAEAYTHPDEVDLWVGGLAEEEIDNTLTGETLRTVLLEQFKRLRRGDRFWYEERFYDEQIQAINQIRLADIIKRNTPIRAIQNNVFIASDIHEPVTPASTPATPTTRFDTPAPAQQPIDEQRRERILEAVRNGHLG